MSKNLRLFNFNRLSKFQNCQSEPCVHVLIKNDSSALSASKQTRCAAFFLAYSTLRIIIMLKIFMIIEAHFEIFESTE